MMSAALRRFLYLTFGALWLSGCLWLVLHFFFPAQTEFGSSPNRWEPPLLTVHGVVAMVAVFFFGWVSAVHIGENWRPRLRRASGLWLTALLAALVLTGVANYYLTAGTWHDGAAAIHEIIGVGVLVPTLIHWFTRRRRANG